MSLYLGNNLISGVTTPVEPTRNIGQIITSTIPLTDAGLHLLDGALILGNGIYADFVTYIAGLVSTYPDLFDTEANWQSAITTYGVCGKFVYDSVNNTVRLPKYNSKIYTGGGTAPVIGNGKTLGLTNGDYEGGLIRWSPSGNQTLGMSANAVGLDVGSSYGSGTQTGLRNATYGVTTDPAHSGLIANLANITTSLEGYYYIVIATSSKTDIQVDIDEIATDLNGKADVDLTNCTKPHIVETYINGASWYRVYSDGWCEQGGDGVTKDTTITFLKAFKDTNYGVFVTFNSTGNYNGTYGVNASYKTSTDFKILTNSSSTPLFAWQACGYIS